MNNDVYDMLQAAEEIIELYDDIDQLRICKINFENTILSSYDDHNDRNGNNDDYVLLLDNINKIPSKLFIQSLEVHLHHELKVIDQNDVVRDKVLDSGVDDNFMDENSIIIDSNYTGSSTLKSNPMVVDSIRTGADDVSALVLSSPSQYAPSSYPYYNHVWSYSKSIDIHNNNSYNHSISSNSGGYRPSNDVGSGISIIYGVDEDEVFHVDSSTQYDVMDNCQVGDDDDDVDTIHTDHQQHRRRRCHSSDDLADSAGSYVLKSVVVNDTIDYYNTTHLIPQHDRNDDDIDNNTPLIYHHDGDDIVKGSSSTPCIFHHHHDDCMNSPFIHLDDSEHDNNHQSAYMEISSDNMNMLIENNHCERNDMSTINNNINHCDVIVYYKAHEGGDGINNYTDTVKPIAITTISTINSNNNIIIDSNNNNDDDDAIINDLDMNINADSTKHITINEYANHNDTFPSISGSAEFYSFHHQLPTPDLQHHHHHHINQTHPRRYSSTTAIYYLVTNTFRVSGE